MSLSSSQGHKDKKHVAIISQTKDQPTLGKHLSASYICPALTFLRNEKTVDEYMDSLLNRHEPSVFEQFLENPLKWLACWLYSVYSNRLENPVSTSNTIRVVCISDTHNHHDELPPIPDGDVLIHAGDLTNSGTVEELHSALLWLSSQRHPHKIFIAGNHDRVLACPPEMHASLLAAFPSLLYADSSSFRLDIRGRSLLVYGSPQTPAYGSWPFQYRRRDINAASTEWARIPPLTDVLITHGPPAHHADRGNGCTALLATTWQVRPRLHVFGHIHAGRGVEYAAWSDAQAAYERICSGAGGWLDVGVILRAFWRPGRVQSTFVNAASLGGFRDDLRRGAIVVDI